MRFLLNGTITFSKNVEEAEQEIAKFLDDANKELLLRGVKEGDEETGARITQWDIKDNVLYLQIRSGHKVRSHDALLRLKNPLTQIIGKKYHIGVRSLHVDNYEITIPTGEGEYDIDFSAAESAAQISDIKIGNKNVIITIDNIDESDIKKQSTNRLIKHITIKHGNKTKDNVDNEIPMSEKQDLTFTMTKSTPGEIIAESPEFETYFEEDVTEKAIELGWIKKFPGRGQWFYGPQMTALQRIFEDILIENIVNRLEFDECLFPKLIPVPVMDKMRYLDGLPEGMYYCSAPKRDPELFNKFKQELAITREVPMNLLKEGLKDPNYVLSAAQCEPFYEFLSHEVLDEKDLPMKLYDKSGWTYRWESGGAKGIDRVHEFQRIELVWVGTPEQTNAIRDNTLELSHEIANELELEWYTEIGDDPFYLEGRKVESRGIEFPDIPKYEMRLKVPGREKGVAIVSANVHGTHFVEGFSIREAHQHKIWTGCTGLGLTRWLFGFLAQKGFNKENWPKLIQERYNTTKTPKMITWPTKS
ncbi:amino acid--[acyl-carrier-protein] ligase 1 [Methanobrevibacter cuticularis]|uniref:Serine--tRNA ligase n=1 Tax=Methanobrevibacter cuticularis TaxID=47311 RepID=A0A166F3A8_9EURY|nr:serine--tRNA ligase [Methanobrevibacter cuticularis]KZX17273.1 amino acid--[acyl-carrier-protein] ligase 1 [Methanobrevibacter cuticularis]